MLESLKKKNLFVVIIPWKFTEFNYKWLELEDYKPACDVLILDISLVTNAAFAKKTSSKRCERPEVVAVPSFFAFVRYLGWLRRRSSEANICVLNIVPVNGSFGDFFCYLMISYFLRGKVGAILGLCNSGCPLAYPGTSYTPAGGVKTEGLGNRARLFFKRNSSFLEVMKKAEAIILNQLSRLIPNVHTHQLVAGEDWEKFALDNRRPGDRIKIVLGSTHDYSNCLFPRSRPQLLNQPQKRTAVFLDDPTPMFIADYVLVGRKVYCTVEGWYPVLRRFFDRVEQETGVTVEIAAHPKSSHPEIAPCYGNRKVYYNQTMEMVRRSEFVITKYSTAISYAVAYRKPVLFLFSNEMKQDWLAMNDIHGMAAMLGQTPINIDEFSSDIAGLLKVDREAYRRYEKACCISACVNRSNVQIILEDIMHIDVGSQFDVQAEPGGAPVTVSNG